MDYTLLIIIINDTTLPEQRFPDDRDECDGEEDECERHRKSVGQLNAQGRRVSASVNP